MVDFIELFITATQSQAHFFTQDLSLTSQQNIKLLKKNVLASVIVQAICSIFIQNKHPKWLPCRQHNVNRASGGKELQILKLLYVESLQCLFITGSINIPGV